MADKEALAAIFAEMAVLLDLSGENTFKVRAYEKAAETLMQTSCTLEELPADPPPGFGKGLLEKVQEFISLGKITEHETLASQFPPGLFELLKVQGLGPKKVRILFYELKIASLDDLETACKKDKLLTLKGFGAKTQKNVLAGIEFLKKFKGQFLYSEAEKIASEFISYLEKHFDGLRVFPAGSLRRKKEIVKDVDLLTSSDAPGPIMKCFTSHPSVVRILGEGGTKSSILTQSGIQADLRIVPPESMGTALCHFTGSKEHNTSMRSLALSQGKKLNEYGLSQGKTIRPIATEKEVFSALGLSFIPPELREDMGEIDLAQKNQLPLLVEANDLIGAVHIHTNYSDGTQTVEQMAKAAQNAGLKWIGITDHSRSAFYAGGVSVENIRNQWKEIDSFNSRNRNFRIFKGIESDILPDGSLDYPPDILSKFDFIIASIHSNTTMNVEEMTGRVVKALENPFLDILGHPTGRLLLNRQEFHLDMEKVLDTCLEKKVILEINANPLRLDLDWRFIRRRASTGMRFIIGPDAHHSDGFGDIRFGLGIARKGALTSKQLLNCISGDDFLEFIRSRRKK